MSRRYAARNPLDGVPQWQQPQHQGTPDVEPPGFDYDPFSKANVMARRASAEIRRKYRIESGDVRRLAKHDREMRAIWQQMMDGKFQPPPAPKKPEKPLSPPPWTWSLSKFGGNPNS